MVSIVPELAASFLFTLVAIRHYAIIKDRETTGLDDESNSPLVGSIRVASIAVYQRNRVVCVDPVPQLLYPLSSDALHSSSSSLLLIVGAFYGRRLASSVASFQ
jgi:hypothetical protein